MTKNKYSSPTLAIAITEDARGDAVQSNSGGCLIADAIKKQYPHLSRVVVDMATIRATDSKQGVRYIYLTPPAAQHVLLSFDQGWPNPAEEVVVRRAVQVIPITRPKSGVRSTDAIRAHRATRLATLEAKERRGESLRREEKASLTALRKKTPLSERPSSKGPRDVRVGRGGRNSEVVVAGGRPLPQGDAHPNLLRGRDRHFGAKLADPGQAFREAVEATVTERLMEAAAG